MKNDYKFKIIARAVLDFAGYTRQVYQNDDHSLALGNKITECADISLVEALQKIAGDPKLDRSHYEQMRKALQRIANLPMTQRKGQPDPHLRARRIAVAALGGSPQKITRR